MKISSNNGYGIDINDSGVVVTSLAKANYFSIAIWTEAEGWVDLQNHLEIGSMGWDLSGASKINSSGEIVGSARRDGPNHAVKLVPLR